MKNLKFIFGILATFLMVSCGPSTSTPSDDPTTSPSEPSISESEPSVPINYVSLTEAVKNTKDSYTLSAVGIRNESLVEAYRSDFFLSTLNRIGFVVLDSDPGFAHQMGIGYDQNSDYVKHQLIMYGRVGDTNAVHAYKDQTFFPIFEEFLTTFQKVNENTYASTDTSISYTLKNYFQSNLIKYCTYYELTVAANGTLEYLHCYEGTADNKYVVSTFKFEKVGSKNDINIYKEWLDAGAVVNERLADYKQIYQKSPLYAPSSVYEGETITVEGTVTTIDSENNLYVGTFDPDYGFLGIKVENKGFGFKQMDAVSVTGKIKTSNFMVYLEDATVTSKGKEGDYLPIYDEEALVDMYGGGVYAVNLFMANPPIFAHSLYSTYTYIKSYEEMSLTENTTITVVFPSFMDGSNNAFETSVIIPKDLSSDKKEEIYNYIKNVSKYGEKTQEEISLEKVLVEFNTENVYGIEFKVTEDSKICKKLTAGEKIETNLGLEGFPIIQNKETVAFTFGGFQGMILEDYYGIENYQTATKGLFISYNDIDPLQYTTYLADIEKYGFKIVDEVNDLYGRRQKVYNLDKTNTYLAITHIYDTTYSEPEGSIEMWVYNRDTVLLPKSPEELLSDVTSTFFDMEEFTRANGSYAADYEVFELDSFAGKMFTNEPLICYTIETTEKSAYNYAKQLISELGYKQYKVNNVPYSYITRGQSHYVLQSKNGVFVDLACYPTTDYTFTGHDKFAYRMEVLVYKADKPFEIKTYNDIRVLADKFAAVDPSLDYAKNLQLPEDIRVEYWADTGLKNVSYGFNTRDEVFIYGDDLDSIWNSIISSLEESVFNKSYQTDTRFSYSTYLNGNGYYFSGMFEKEKGYIRVMNDLLGVSFY